MMNKKIQEAAARVFSLIDQLGHPDKMTMSEYKIFLEEIGADIEIRLDADDVKAASDDG